MNRTSALSRVTPLALQTVVARASAIAGSLVQVIVISRALNLDSAGSVFVLFTVMNLAATVGRFGTDNLVLRRIASAQTDAAVEAGWLRSVCWICSSIVAFFLFFSLWAGVLPLPGGRISLLDAAVVGLMTIPYALSVFAGAVLRGSGRIVAGVAAELGISPWLTSGLVGLQSAFWHATTSSVLVALLISGVATAVWSMRLVRPTIDTASGLRQRGATAYVRAHLSSLSALMGTSLLFFALVWIPQLALGLVGTGAQVAQYTVAARIGGFINIFPAIQTSYLGPRFAALAHAGRVQNLSKQAGGASAMAMAIAAPLLIVISLAPNRVLDLFGNGYESAELPMLVLCTGSFVALGLGPVNVVMLTAGFERTALFLNLSLLAGVFLAVWLGTAQLGVLGLAAVSTMGNLLYALMASLFISKRLRANVTITAYFQSVFRMHPKMAIPLTRRDAGLTSTTNGGTSHQPMRTG